MRRGKLLAALRVTVVAAFAFSMCTAGQAMSPPSAQAATSYATGVAVGSAHACAIVGGTLYCWGDNSNGELGTGNYTSYNTPQPVVSGGSPSVPATWAQVSAGNYYTCALVPGGVPYCWGRNNYGELGLNTGPTLTTNVTRPTDVLGSHTFSQISTSDNGDHTCAIQSGSAWCWGWNGSGQLGTSTSVPGTNSPFPVAVYNTSPGVLAGKTLTRIATGTSHTCALDDVGNAYCWGLNSSGQLGNNSATTSGVPVPVYNASPGVLAGKTLTEITAGTNHTCALDSAGNAYCWGDNTYGELGNGTSGPYSTVPVAVDTSTLPAGTTWAQITAGGGFTCAITATPTPGKAYCWGNGYQSQLGTGSGGQSTVPTAVATNPTYPNSQLPATAVLTQINSGLSTTCAMDTASNVYCWGVGGAGQLGNGHNNDSNVPVRVDLPAPPPGELSLSCPGSADLGEGTPGSTVSGAIGPCTVADTRATGAGSWMVTVASTDFTYTGVTPAYVIPAAKATYAIPSASITGVTGTAPTNSAAPPGKTFTAAGPSGAVSVLTGASTTTVTWNPMLAIAIPPGAALTNEATPTDVYQGTITTSVIG